MLNLDEKSIIDLSNCKTTEELVNRVIRAVDTPDKPLKVALQLDDTEINQSQMIFIKSLIESYGSNLEYVKTKNAATISICNEVHIQAINTDEMSADAANKADKSMTLGDYVLKSLAEEEKTKKADEAASIQEDGEDIADTKKQTISVYRKADEEEKKAEFKDEDIDFYATPTEDPIVVDSSSTIYVNQTLRSGQILEYDGNVVIIGDCHPGSEIKATGDITVWGVLGSIAHAGAKGNKEAKIRALKMNAVQLRIADCYSRRPDQGNIPYIVKSSVFTPEEAKIVDDNIVLFRMAQD